MTQSNLLELAKQGDPTAIATMMNQQLQPRGITATTDLLPGRCLQVVLESAQVLNRQALTTFVQKGLRNLGVQTLDSVKIIGQQIGSSEPAWVQDLVMAASPSLSATEPFPDAVPPKFSDAAPPKSVTPPPPPPNRGVTPIAPVPTTEPLTAESLGTEPLDSGVELSTDAAALHDFHDSRLSGSSPQAEDELPGYSPIPGAYRPLEADNALLLNDSDFGLRGTHALDYPDQPLEESDDYDYGDDYDVMPGGSYALHHPDEPLDDPDEYGDNYDEGFVVNPSYNPTSSAAPTDGSLSLDEYDDNYDPGFTAAATSNQVQFDNLSEGQEPEPSNAVVSQEEREPAQSEEGYSPIPWTALLVSLVATWIIGLVGLAIWTNVSNQTASQPASGDPSTAASPPASPTTQANVPPSPPVAPASPTPGQSPAAQPSPTATANPALQFNTSPQASPTTPANPSPQANASPTQPSPQQAQQPTPQRSPGQAVAIAPPAPPAITCRPTPTGPNTAPVELSNLGFDTSIANADGHYVVGCITNHSDQAIAKLTISFQGQSTQNQAVSQTGSTDLTFTNLRPRQAVPFRSFYTVNPEINTMTINSISWTPSGTAQPRQVQVSFPLRR